MIGAVQVDGPLVVVAGSGVASIVGLLSLFTTRAKTVDDKVGKHVEALEADNDALRAENHELRTEVEKWQRRAQDWRKANGDPPWPE